MIVITQQSTYTEMLLHCNPASSFCFDYDSAFTFKITPLFLSVNSQNIVNNPLTIENMALVGEIDTSKRYTNMPYVYVYMRLCS